MNSLVKSIIVLNDESILEHDELIDRSRRSAFRKTMAKIGRRLTKDDVRKIQTAVVIFHGSVYHYDPDEARALYQVNRTVH